MCSYGSAVESMEQFLLHCPQFVTERRTLLSTLGNFNHSLIENASNVLTQILLFGNISISSSNNSKILNVATDFISWTIRFDEVVPTDHNEINNLTSLITCFSAADLKNCLITCFYLGNLLFQFY